MTEEPPTVTWRTIHEPTTYDPDFVAAVGLQTIFADIVKRPLTAEEKARCHQHVATVNAIFDQAIRASLAPPSNGEHDDGA